LGVILNNIMPWYLYVAIIGAGFVAGFINILAGSGSLVTLPLLIFIGLPATVANGTNRVGVLLQNIVGVSSFKHSKVLDIRGVLILSIPSIIGSVIGAQIATSINEALMRRTIGVIMVIMLFVILLQPKRWLEGELDNLGKHPSWLQIMLFFAIGIYGGFIQAGVGIFYLSALVLGIGYNLVRGNAVKTGIILFQTMAALLVFIFHGQVNWVIGLILSLGYMFGAWIAAKFAISWGAVWVQRVLIAIVVISAADLLGIIELMKRLILSL
jgi:uncharacterized membrane protein YfcA